MAKPPMQLAIKAGLAAALLCAAPCLAQDQVATYEGTLTKRAAMLEQVLVGRFANAEQAAFADALTPEGGTAFKDEYEVVIGSNNGGIEINASELITAGKIEISVDKSVLAMTISSAGAACEGIAEPLLEGFEITFSGRQETCPFTPKMTVLQSGIHLAASDKRPALQLSRARDFTCWVSIPRADESWFFKAGVPLHDQGGWAWVETDEETPQRIGLRMRNAVWPYGTSRPSLVLYVHKPEDLERAASYAWAEPDAQRIGINLRWMQGSCTAR